MNKLWITFHLSTDRKLAILATPMDTILISIYNSLNNKYLERIYILGFHSNITNITRLARRNLHIELMWITAEKGEGNLICPIV